MPEGMVTCSRCGGELLSGADMCHVCGAPAVAEPVAQAPHEDGARRFCVKCGAELRADTSFCHACGAARGGAAESEPVAESEKASPPRAERRLSARAKLTLAVVVAALAASGLVFGGSAAAAVLIEGQARSHRKAHRYDQALKAYGAAEKWGAPARALASVLRPGEPTRARLLVGKADTLACRGDLKEAVALYSAAIDADADAAGEEQVHLLRGLCNEVMGDKAAAREDYRLWYQADPSLMSKDVTVADENHRLDLAGGAPSGTTGIVEAVGLARVDSYLDKASAATETIRQGRKVAYAYGSKILYIFHLREQKRISSAARDREVRKLDAEADKHAARASKKTSALSLRWRKYKRGGRKYRELVATGKVPLLCRTSADMVAKLISQADGAGLDKDQRSYVKFGTALMMIFNPGYYPQAKKALADYPRQQGEYTKAYERRYRAYCAHERKVSELLREHYY